MSPARVDALRRSRRLAPPRRRPPTGGIARRPRRHPSSSRCRISRSSGPLRDLADTRASWTARAPGRKRACTRWRPPMAPAGPRASSANATATSTSAISRSSMASPSVFDCIEFNEDMRWTDVMNEVAFMAMDLQHRRRRDLAYRFLTPISRSPATTTACASFASISSTARWCAPRSPAMRARQLEPGDGQPRCAREYSRLPRPCRTLRRRTAAGNCHHPWTSGAARRRCRSRCSKPSGRAHPYRHRAQAAARPATDRPRPGRHRRRIYSRRGHAQNLPARRRRWRDARSTPAYARSSMARS